MAIIKSKTLVLIAAFTSIGAGILYLPQYAAPYLGMSNGVEVKVKASLKSIRPDDAEKLKGTLFGVTAKSAGEVKETSLHIVLKGTAPASKPSDSFAVVLVNGKDEKLVSLGDEIVRGVSLYQVDAHYVLLNRNGSIEKLSYPANPDRSSASKSSYFVSSEPVKEPQGSVVMNNSVGTQNILRNGSMVQAHSATSHRNTNSFQTFVENQVINHYQSEYQKDPKGTLASIGVKQSASGYQVGNGSPLLNFGLKEGDVVMSVNGMQASQIIGNSKAIAQIRAAGVANMQVQRNGSVIQISRTF